MTTSVRDSIISSARYQLAVNGVDGTSIRDIADKVGVSPSVLYYHFSNKEALLKEVFYSTNSALGVARGKLPALPFDTILKKRIEFQFDHAEEITAVLKYYLHFRLNFDKNSRGFLPEKSYLHIEEVLQIGQTLGIYSFPNLEAESKAIVHVINGFILEYFPTTLSSIERESLVSQISDFILRAISPYKL